MANTTIYNLPALNTVDSTSLFPLSSNVTATPTTYQASIGNIGHAITGNLRMSGDNLSSTNQIVGIYGNGTDQATALTLTNSGDAALWANANVTINSNSQGSNPQWIFDTTGNLVLPTGTPSINYANGDPYGGSGNANTGNITFSGTTMTGPTGSADNYSIYIQPSVEFINTLQILPTFDNDIHLFEKSANAITLGVPGGSSLSIGGPNSPNANIIVQASGGTWIFDTTGNLTAPGNIIMDNGNDGNIESTGNVNIISNGNTWVFGTDSNTTFPIDGNVNLGNIAIATHANFVVSAFIGNSSANIFLNYDGSGNFTGNLTSANANLGNLATANYVNVSGNITSGNANLGNIAIANYFSTSGTGGDIALTGGNISGANVITANTFVGNGSQLTDIVTSVPSQTILPTIQSITAIPMLVGYLGGGQGGVTVTVANTIPVTEYGVIVTAGTNVQTYAPGDLGSIPGTGNITFTTGLSSPATFTVYAYVTSNAGTYYSDAVTGTSGMCVLAGTKIALSDGTYKAIEDITYTDKLLSWDFDRGCYAETTALWIKYSETGSQYNLLTFSDGTTLRTFDQHRIFNKQAGAFTYPMTEATPVGTVTVNEHGQEITLTNKQVIQDTIEYYNVITDYHMNLFSDSVLTSCRFNNIYPITDMKFVKDGRTLRTRDEFENVPDRFFHGLRLAEQTTDIETVEWYVNRLLSSEVLTQSELTV